MTATHKFTNKPFSLNVEDAKLARSVAYIDVKIVITSDMPIDMDIADIDKEEIEISVTAVNSISVLILDKEEVEVKAPKAITEKLRFAIEREIESYTWSELNNIFNN